MSQALDQIESYLNEFSEGIERCANASTFKRADWQDAYNRLSRLRDRYKKEKPNLTASEKKPLAKVFEDDKFIETLLDTRQIGEHVTKRTTPTVAIYTTGATVKIPYEVSALPMFAGPTVTIPDTDGRHHHIDHLQNLREAERRITTALARAKQLKDQFPIS